MVASMKSDIQGHLAANASEFGLLGQSSRSFLNGQRAFLSV